MLELVVDVGEVVIELVSPRELAGDGFDDGQDVAVEGDAHAGGRGDRPHDYPPKLASADA